MTGNTSVSTTQDGRQADISMATQAGRKYFLFHGVFLVILEVKTKVAWVVELGHGRAQSFSNGYPIQIHKDQ